MLFVMMASSTFEANGSLPGEFQAHQFNQHQIDSLKTLDKYQYEVPVEKPVDFWQQIKWKIKQWLNHIFDHSSGALTFRYTILILVIGIIVFQLLRADASGIFGKKNKQVTRASIYQKINPVEVSFDEQIQQAVADQHYREAIRFWYLKSLKLLHVNRQIIWKEHKTNADFLLEIKNQELSEQFRSLCLIYDYTWYGEFLPSEHAFEKINNQFIAFAQSLNLLYRNE